jgi:uncharacterized protein (TIGR01777 family)
MRVLIAGSSGFLGSALTERLRRSGAEIYRVVRTPESETNADGNANANAFYDANGHSLDLTRLPGGSLEGFDAVYAVGGDPLTPRRWRPSKRDSIRSSRVDLVGSLARAIASSPNNPPTLISMSAVGLYGDRGDESLTEKSSAGKGYVADLCLAWEHATAPAKTNGARVVTARAGIIFGSGGGFIKTLTPLFRLGLGARLGNGRQWMSWIAQTDAVEALVRFATDDTFHGPVNLTSPNPMRNKQFTRLFATALGRPALLTVPRAAIVVATGRRVANEFLLQSARVMPDRLSASGFDFRHADPTDAIEVALDRTPRIDE